LANDEEDSLDTTLEVFVTAGNRRHRVVTSLKFPCSFHTLKIKKTSPDVVHKILALVAKTEGKKHLEYPDVEGRIILRRIYRNWDVCMDWIDLAQDRAR
jgi:hypothetical protein